MPTGHNPPKLKKNSFCRQRHFRLLSGTKLILTLNESFRDKTLECSDILGFNQEFREAPRLLSFGTSETSDFIVPGICNTFLFECSF